MEDREAGKERIQTQTHAQPQPQPQPRPLSPNANDPREKEPGTNTNTNTNGGAEGPDADTDAVFTPEKLREMAFLTAVLALSPEGWPLRQALEEIESERRHEHYLASLPPGNLVERMDAFVLSEGDATQQVMLVECRTPQQRAMVHSWADGHTGQPIHHYPCAYSDFAPNRTFQCKHCDTLIYDDDMGWRNDWSSIVPGKSLGTMARCHGCDENVYFDYGNGYEDADLEENKEDFKVRQAFNAVIVSKVELPKEVGGFVYGCFSRGRRRKCAPRDESVKEGVFDGMGLREAIDRKMRDAHMVTAKWSDVEPKVSGLRAKRYRPRPRVGGK